MKKLIAFSFMLFMSLATFADDYTLYIAAMTSQQAARHKLADIQKITFENGNVVVNLKSGETESTAISSVSRMYFSLTSQAMEDVTGDGVVDTQDALQIYNFMQNAGPNTQVGVEDVTGDGIVDTQDVLKVYEYMQTH